jgi:hypothetical protein
MPATAVRAHDRLTGDVGDVHDPAETSPLSPPPATARRTELDDEPARSAEFPRHRAITAHVTDGLDGVLKVAMMLRGRGYRVRDLSVDVREGVVESVFTCTIALSTSDTALLLERLRRVPVVVSAHCR